MTGTAGGILSPKEFNGAFCHPLQIGQDFTPASGSRAEKRYTKFKHFFCKAELRSKIQMMILTFPEKETFDAQEVFDPLSYPQRRK